jgi:hypothetical protein
VSKGGEAREVKKREGKELYTHHTRPSALIKMDEQEILRAVYVYILNS